MIYISLGCCCETSFVIDRVCGGSKRYPFDWLSIHDFNDVIRAIESDFKNFTITPSRPVGWKHANDDTVKSYPQIGDYDMHVVHELEQETLDRRVERFRKTMKDDEHITFILKTHLSDFSCVHPYAPCMDKVSVNNLEQAIRTHRKKNYTIIVVNESFHPKRMCTWGDSTNNTNVIMTNIIGLPERGSERGMVIIQCYYKHDNKCIDQWREILGK